MHITQVFIFSETYNQERKHLNLLPNQLKNGFESYIQGSQGKTFFGGYIRAG